LISKIPFKLLARTCCPFWLSLMAIQWFRGLKHICSTRLFEVCSSLITARNYSSVKMTFSQLCEFPSHDTPRWIAWPLNLLIFWLDSRMEESDQDVRRFEANSEMSLRLSCAHSHSHLRLFAHTLICLRAHACFDVIHRSRHSDLHFSRSHMLRPE
jgi:hypothetical protein